MTAMKEGGINASEGANALKSGLASMINPTAKASAMLQGFGINIKKIVVDNKGDLKKTVTDFATALNKLDPLNRAQAIEQMFGKFQFARLSTLFANVTKEGTQASRVLDLAGASIQELAALSEKELGQTSESAMNKFRSSIEQLKLALVPVGEQFLKVITPIAEFITKILDKFNSLGDGTKKVIVVLTAVVAGLGPVLLMTFGLLMNGLANIIKGFTFLKSIFNKAGRATGTLGDEVKYMTTEQRNAAAVASSLDQVHRKLAQTFSSEAAAVDGLTRAYYRAVAAQSQFMPIRVPLQRGAVKKRAKGKPARVGGTGNQDTELALLMPGETVIPTAMSKKYGGLINGMIADNIPGYKKGRGISFGGQTFDIPVSSNEQLLQEALGKFSKDLGGVTAVLSELEKKAKLAGDGFKHLSSDALKEALDAQGVPRNNPKGTSATLYDNEKYVFAHAKPQNQEITDPTRINALADATSSKSLARDLRATAAKGGKVQQLSSLGFMMPESANKRTAGGNFEMGRDQMASLFKGPKAERTLSPIYQAWAESNGLTLKSVLADPKLTKEMHTSVAKFGSLVGDEISKLPTNFGEKDFYNAVDKAVARIDKQDKKLAKAISNMQKTSMLAVDNSVSGKALERRTAGKRDIGLRTALGTPINFTNYKDVGNEKFLTTGDRVAAAVGAKDAKAYSDAVEKGTEDIYVKSRKRKSPHRLVPKDGRDDARAYNGAVDKELTRGSKKRRVAYRAQGAPPILPVNLIPPVVPQVIPSGYTPPEGPMYGPRTPTKYDKTVGKAVGKFRGSKIARLPKSGMGMGLSSALMMGSYMIPGKTGEIVQKVSMAAFALSSLTTPISLLVRAFGVAAVALGSGIAAAVVGIGLAMYLFSKSSKKAAEDIKEAAKRESEARIGSARAVEQFAKTFNKALPSEREFSRSNRQKIKGSGTLVDQYAKDYATEGNISTQIINQAAKKGQVEGIDAIAIDVANKAAILGLSPEEIAANIKAASRLIEADEVSVTAKIQKLLAPGGKDILKEPLTIDARLNYLNKQSAPIIKNLDKSINEISKIQFDQVNPLPGAESFNYKSLQSAAGDWTSITNSWKGDGFWDKALAAGKVWTMFQKHGINSAINSAINPSIFGVAKNLVLDFKAPSAVESYDAVQERIQNASTRVSIAFMQQKEALALLNGQYADGQISEEEYNKQKQISSNNLNSLEKSSIKLVKQLNKIDTSGDSAAGVIKDLAAQSLAALKAANPDKFDEITEAISDLPDDAEVGIYMGYTRGSLTLMDLAIIPEVLKEIEGKEYTAAITIIAKSGLSNEGVLLQKQAAEAKLAALQQIAASSPVIDRDIIRAILYYQSEITKFDRIIKEIEGVDQKGSLNSDFNPYEDLEDGTDGLKTATERYLDVLEKEIDALKAKRDAQKDANDEVQREIDLKNKLADLEKQSVDAKISGDYIKAAMLSQEANQLKIKYDQETELKKKDAEIARLEARYNAIKDGANLTALEKSRIQPVTRANGGAVKGFNTGGNVRGAGSATSDSIPAYLSNGEYVIKADSVKKYGTKTFDALNAGRFAEGGMIQGFRTGGLNRIVKSGISSVSKMISSKLSGSKSAVLNTREQWLKNMNDLMSEYFSIDNNIKIKESSNYEKMVFPKILDSSDLRDLGDPRVRSLNIVRTMEDLKTGNTGYLKTLQEVTPDEVRREVFGSLFARRAGLLAPENLPVTTGLAAPHQLGVFSRSLQEMSPGSISERRLSEKLKLPQSKDHDDKKNALSAKIYASLGMTSERSYRNAILDSMGFVDNHGGNLYINPIQKQAGAIDFGRIGESGYSITQFADSGSLEQLKNKYYRQYVDLPESERAAYLEGLTKAKATLSGIKRSEIEEMLLASGYNKSDMPLSIYKNYIDNVIKALQDRLSSKPIQGWDEIIPKLPIDENWYKTTDILTTSDAAGGYINNTNLNITKGLRDKISKLGIPQYANGGAVQGFRTGGLNRFISGAVKKMAFSIPNKINQIKNYLKVRSLIKDGMYHGSQPTGLRGEEYLQGKNILEGAETYDPHYGMGFFGTSSKSEAEMYASGYNSPNNWSESFGSMNKITKAPFGKYVDFTRGTNSIKWQNYKLYQALGMKKDGYLGNYLTENLGDIMAGQNVTGSIMNRINDGMVPGDMASAKWLAWAKPKGVHTEEYMGSFAPKKPASLLDNLKSKFSILNKPKKYNTGGHVLGAGTATSDSIPAMLSDGEYVIRASSVKKYGTETFDALNAQRFSEGSPGGVKPIKARTVMKLNAKAGATWQTMEEFEKFLSLKYGADKKDSGLEKWSKALGRVAFNALQGGVSGVSGSPSPLGALIGTAFGLGEGISGLIQDGSQYGVKGGSYATPKGAKTRRFNPEKELKKINLKDSGLKVLETAGYSAAFGLAFHKVGQLAKAANKKFKLTDKIPEPIKNKVGSISDSLRPKIEQLSQPFANPFKSDQLKSLITATLIGFQKPFLNTGYIGAPDFSVNKAAVTRSTVAKSSVERNIQQQQQQAAYVREVKTIDDFDYPIYQIGNSKDKISFQGRMEGDTQAARAGVRIVSIDPQDLLAEALRMDPNNLEVKSLYNNFVNKKFGQRELAFLTEIAAANAFDDDMGHYVYENTDGFAQVLAALTGDKYSKDMISQKVAMLYETQMQTKESVLNNYYKGPGTGLSLRDRLALALSDGSGKIKNPKQAPLFHEVPADFAHLIKPRNKDGSIDIRALGTMSYRYKDPRGVRDIKVGDEAGIGRSTLHLSPEATAFGHSDRQGSLYDTIVMSDLSSMLKANPNRLDNANPIDMSFDTQPGEAVNFPNAQLSHAWTDVKAYIKTLTKRGLIKFGDPVPPIIADPKRKEILRLMKDEYTDADRIAMYHARYPDETLEDAAYRAIKYIQPGDEQTYIYETAQMMMRKQHGIMAPWQKITDQWSLPDKLQKQYERLAIILDVPMFSHNGSLQAINETGLFDSASAEGIGGTSSTKADFQKMSSIRMGVLHGQTKTNITKTGEIDYRVKAIMDKKAAASARAELKASIEQRLASLKKLEKQLKEKGIVHPDRDLMQKLNILGYASGGLINQQIKKPTYSIPSFATGIDYLPNDMIAQLHQGERVLTKEENKTYSSSAPTTNIININGSDLNKKEIAQAVMVELDRAKNKNNKTNMVGR